MARAKISKSKQKEIAKEHITELFTQAQETFGSSPQLSDRYVEIARKIAMKFRMRMPKEYKRQFCTHCYKYLMPGKNSRVRVQKGKVIILCQECKKFTRIPIKPRKN